MLPQPKLTRVMSQSEIMQCSTIC